MANIRTGLRRRKIDSATVESYAALFLRDDFGLSINAADHHLLWLSLITDETIPRLLIIAPPESAKTTWIISAYVGTYIGFYPERSVIIGSTSGAVAEKRSLTLRRMVETPDYQSVFPDARPVRASDGLKWSSTEWSLAPSGIPTPGRLHPTIAAYGTGGSVIGSRADLVIADDLLDFDNTRTQHQREFVETWFYNSLLSRRKSKTGRTIVIGTAWHHDDLYQKLRRSGSWVICHTPLLSETDEFFAFLSYPDDFPGLRLGEPIAAASV